MDTVSFTRMSDGTKEDYELVDRLEQEYISRLPERLLEALRLLAEHPSNAVRGSLLSQHGNSLVLPEDDVASHLVNAILSAGQLLQRLHQIVVRCLTDGIIHVREHSRKPYCSSIDTHL